MSEHPFAITLDAGSSRENRTGSWRVERPVYVDRMPPTRTASRGSTGRPAPSAHGADHGGRPGDHVAAGPDTLARRAAGLLVGHDVALLAHLEAGRGHGDQRVRAVADGAHRRVHRHEELGAGDLDRAATAGGVGLTQLHAPALDLGEPAALVADEAHRQGEKVEDDALLLGVLDLLGARRQLVVAAPVDDVDLVGAQTQGRARRVHGHVAAAEHGHPAPTA